METAASSSRITRTHAFAKASRCAALNPRRPVRRVFAGTMIDRQTHACQGLHTGTARNRAGLCDAFSKER
jgi:hypothetical protein